jgi:hypothetical protein
VKRLSNFGVYKFLEQLSDYQLLGNHPRTSNVKRLSSFGVYKFFEQLSDYQLLGKGYVQPWQLKRCPHSHARIFKMIFFI